MTQYKPKQTRGPAARRHASGALASGLTKETAQCRAAKMARDTWEDWQGGIKTTVAIKTVFSKHLGCFCDQGCGFET